MKHVRIYKNKYSNLLTYIQIYIAFTFFLFLFGPINWKSNNKLLMGGVLFAYVLFLTLGYRYGAKCKLYKSAHPLLSEYNIIKITKIIVWISIVYSIFYIFRYGRTFSISSIINNTINNFINPAAQYAKTHHQGSMTDPNLLGGGFMSLIVTFSGPLTIPAVVLPILYFDKLSFAYKIISIFGIVLQVFGAVIAGTNEGLFNIGIYIISVILILRQRKRKLKRKKKSFVSFIFIGILLIGLLAFFTNNISQRTGDTFLFPTIGINKYDRTAPILQFIPQFLQPTLAYLTVYLCEGYYGMSLALGMEWIPTFGTGFSSFIRNNIEELLGVNLIQYSYQGRIEKLYGWGANKNWHTAYTWFANDVSFFGVALIMFIIGFLIIRSFRDSVENGNPFACVLFSILMMQIFFLSANNKIFASPTTFITFWLFWFLWWLTKRGWKEKSKINSSR